MVIKCCSNPLDYIIVSREGNAILPGLFSQGLRLNSTDYVHVLDKVLDIRMGVYTKEDQTCSNRTQHLLIKLFITTTNLPDHVTQHIWPPNSPVLNDSTIMCGALLKDKLIGIPITGCVSEACLL